MRRALFAGGEGLFTATFTALLSKEAGPERQGRVQAADQALQGLTFGVVPVAGHPGSTPKRPGRALLGRHGPSPLWCSDSAPGESTGGAGFCV